MPENDGRHEECTFPDRDGKPRLFELHMRYPPRPGRLHFALHRRGSLPQATVAYIGPKLGI